MIFKTQGVDFDTDNPKCPGCGGPMWDNHINKKFPKAPDYSCKDKNCKNEKGFTTGVYLPKGKTVGGVVNKPANIPPVTSKVDPHNVIPSGTLPPMTGVVKPAYNNKDYGNGVPPSMYGAWAMNLVIALVGQGKINSVAEGISAYREAIHGVGNVIEGNKNELNKDVIVPVAQQEIQVSNPVMKTPVVSDDLPDPLKEIEKELGTTLEEISMDGLSDISL